MTDKNIKRIVISALIAALYATLTIALAPISYLAVSYTHLTLPTSDLV